MEAATINTIFVTLGRIPRRNFLKQKGMFIRFSGSRQIFGVAHARLSRHIRSMVGFKGSCIVCSAFHGIDSRVSSAQNVTLMSSHAPTCHGVLLHITTPMSIHFSSTIDVATSNSTIIQIPILVFLQCLRFALYLQIDSKSVPSFEVVLCLWKARPSSEHRDAYRMVLPVRSRIH